MSVSSVSSNEKQTLDRNIFHKSVYSSHSKLSVSSSTNSKSQNPSSPIISFSSPKGSKFKLKASGSHIRRTSISRRHKTSKDIPKISVDEVLAKLNASKKMPFFEREETVFYKIGGRNDYGQTLNTICAFDTTFTNFQVIKALNRTVESSCSTLGGSKYSHPNELFIAGGRLHPTDDEGSTFVNLVLINIRHNMLLEPLFQARFFGSAVEIQDKYYVSGGWSNGTILNSVEVYHTDLGTHEAFTSMIQPRACFQMVSSRNVLYALGGSPNECLPVEYHDLRTPKWSTVENSWSPIPIYNSTSCIIGNEIYVCTNSQFFCFDLTASSWRQLPDPPLKTYHHQSFAYLNRIYKISGENGEETEKKFTFYKPATNSWHDPQSMPRGFSRASTFVGSYL